MKSKRKKYSLNEVMKKLLNESVTGLPKWKKGKTLRVDVGAFSNFTFNYKLAGSQDWTVFMTSNDAYNTLKGLFENDEMNPYYNYTFPSNLPKRYRVVYGTNENPYPYSNGMLFAVADLDLMSPGEAGDKTFAQIGIAGTPETFKNYATGDAVDASDTPTDNTPTDISPSSYTEYVWNKHIRPGGSGWNEDNWEDFIDKAKTAGVLNSKEAMAAKSDWGSYASQLGYSNGPSGAKSFFNKVKGGSHSKKEDSELPDIPNYESGRNKGLDEGKRYSLLKLMEAFLRD